MEKEKWVKLYEGGKSCPQIAKESGVSSSYVAKFLKSFGVKFRGMSAADNLDEHFFDKIDSEEKAYWLYFLAADGNLSKKNYVIQLTLAEIDKDHVVKFAQAIRSKAKIALRRRVRAGRKDTVEVHIQFKSKVMWQALYDHGIRPDKTFNLKLPSVSMHLERHAWRGMIDGDGTIPVMTERNHRRSVIQLYGNLYTCERFKEFVERKVGKVGAVHQIKNKCTFTVASEGKTADKIIDLLYKGARVYLDRKYDVAMKRFPAFQDGIHVITRPYAEEFFRRYHYMSSLPICTANYALIEGGNIVGVAAVGVPSNPGVSLSVFGEGYSNKVLELRRFALRDNAKNQASKFLSGVIRKLRVDFPGALAMISFADPEFHSGILYQAANAIYLGSINTLEIVCGDDIFPMGRHTADLLIKRGVDISKCEVRVRKGKHKYVFLLPKGKKEKEELKSRLKPVPVKYPK